MEMLPPLLHCLGGGTLWHAESAMHLLQAQVHDQVMPTVYTLWRYPGALPYISTYSEVSPKVRERSASRVQLTLAGTDVTCKLTLK
jgi:hypothetical protein